MESLAAFGTFRVFERKPISLCRLFSFACRIRKIAKSRMAIEGWTIELFFS